jgi:peptidoglycan/xylan/chitin deacetylase (PgdA/CDA1 family)
VTAPARRIKDAAGRLLYAARAHRPMLRETGVVVAFHRVNDRTAGDALSVGTAAFEAFCRFFRRHFDVLPLGELVGRLKARRPLAGCLAITFDDGYLDNYECAAPVLSGLGLPATFFVVSQFVGTDAVAWWDAELSPPPAWMSWEQVRELRARGFEIGAHTRTHADLGAIAGEVARKEIAGGREELEARLGAPVDLFAYPYGRPSAMAEENRALVREAGFRCCVSCHGGLVTPRTDPFRLPRVPVNGWFSGPGQLGLEVVLGRA